MTDLYYPLRSLREGHWFKLICGASFQHLPSVRNLALAYALAGADCIDVAADPAVISTAKTALKLAGELIDTDESGSSYAHGTPWLMVSLSDGDDPHFRKAEFDPSTCPPSCTRPCELICPAQAIVFETPIPKASSALASNAIQRNRTSGSGSSEDKPISGVLSDRCYGCGRCLPVCPVQQISTCSYVSTPAAIAPLVLQAGVDALEIHTQIGHLEDFRRLWQAIVPWVCNLKLVAISCPDGDGLFDYLWALYGIVSPLSCPLVWQMDGRPMSGDIGIGATRAAVRLGQKVLTAGLPGYIQLAGGTNRHTVPKLKALGLLHPRLLDASIMSDSNVKKPGTSFDTHSPAYVAGVAYGSYARTLLIPLLNQLDAIGIERSDHQRSVDTTMPSMLTPVAASQQSVIGQRQTTQRSQALGLEDVPDLLWQAVTLARTLVSQLKAFNSSQQTRLNL